MKISVVIYILILFSCNPVGKRDVKNILDFGSFTIETPEGWTKINEHGVDSYVGRIAIDAKDTLEFDLGWYSNTLTETDPEIIERSFLKDMGSHIDTSQYIIVDRRIGVDIDKYKRNNISWDTIDGRKAKIVYPRRHGIGTTGIYIDSLWMAGDDVDKFNLYGQNLSVANEVAVLKALKTLKFYKHRKSNNL